MTEKLDPADKLLYWAQNEDMIDQYYTERGQDLMDARHEIIKLRENLRLYFTAFNKACARIKELEMMDD
jgi:hypothetical protein